MRSTPIHSSSTVRGDAIGPAPPDPGTGTDPTRILEAHDTWGRGIDETPEPSRVRLPRWWPLALYVLASLVTVSPALLTGGTFGAVDTIEQFAPHQERNPDLYRTGMPLQGDQAIQLVMPAEFWQSARGGDLQLWEPDLAGGTPMGTGLWNRILSPFHLVGFALLPARWAPTASAFLATLVAQLGTHLLARRFGLSRRGAVVAAVGYGLGGPVVAFTHRFHEAMLAPLLLATVDGAMTSAGRRRWSWAAAAGGVTAAVLLSGFPATALMTIYAAGALALVRVVRRRAEGRRVVLDVVRLGVTTVAGAAIASVQLLPSLEFLRDTVLVERRFGIATIPREYLATGVAGRFLGTWQDDDVWLPDLVNPIEGQMTIGVLLLAAIAVLVLVGLRSSTRLPRSTEVIVAVTAVVMLHASFVGGFVQASFQRLPFLDQTLFTRSRFLASLAIALLGGIAVERLLARDPTGDRPSWWLRGAGLYIVGLVAWGTAHATVQAVELKQVRELATDLAPVVAAAIVAAVLVWRLPRWAGTDIALPVLLAVELLVGSWGFVPTSPPSTFPTGDDPAFEVIAASTGPGGQARFLDPPNLAAYGHSGALLDLKDAMAHWPVPGRYQELFETAGPSVAAASAGKAVFEPILGPDVPVDSPSLDAVAAGWWLTDLETLPMDLGPAAGRSLARQSTFTLTVPPGTGPIRALTVGPILEEPVGCVTGWWEATVTPDDGTPIVVRRTLRNVVPAGTAVFPLPDVTATTFDVSMRVDGPCSLDVRDALATMRPRTDDARLELVAVDGWQAYRRPTARPRLEVTTDIVTEPDASRRLGLLASRDPDGPVVTSAAVEPLDATRADARFVRDDADEVVVEVTSDGAALVVLRDNLAPGWTVTVDDEPAELVEVDHAFRGVVVPAGEHVVHHRYSPQSLRVGGVFALAGLVVLVATGLLGRRRPENDGSSGRPA